MAKFNKGDLKMILGVTEPGKNTLSQTIADDIKKKYGREFTNREVALAIAWSLNTSFEKTRNDSTQVYTYMRKPRFGGM